MGCTAVEVTTCVFVLMTVLGCCFDTVIKSVTSTVLIDVFGGGTEVAVVGASVAVVGGLVAVVGGSVAVVGGLVAVVGGLRVIVESIVWTSVCVTTVSITSFLALICCSTASDPPPTVAGMVTVVVEFAHGTQVPVAVIVFVVYTIIDGVYVF